MSASASGLVGLYVVMACGRDFSVLCSGERTSEEAPRHVFKPLGGFLDPGSFGVCADDLPGDAVGFPDLSAAFYWVSRCMPSFEGLSTVSIQVVEAG